MHSLLIALLASLCLAFAAHANEAAPAAADPVLEARMTRITAELRCLVCQNQTIADSNADLAQDLRRQVREMLARGDDDAKIIRYMTDRYGDFVLYRPPFKATTALLWIGPFALVLLGAGIFLVLVRRRRAAQLPPEEVTRDRRAELEKLLAGRGGDSA